MVSRNGVAGKTWAPEDMGSWCQSIGETSLQQNTAEFDIQREVFNSEIFSLRDYFYVFSN